jgi:hypothetical protein
LLILEPRFREEAANKMMTMMMISRSPPECAERLIPLLFILSILLLKGKQLLRHLLHQLIVSCLCAPVHSGCEDRRVNKKVILSHTHSTHISRVIAFDQRREKFSFD